jgi:ATP-dependent DNA ligase
MERIIRKDKIGRERFVDISVEDLGNGTADIVKRTGMVGSDKAIESRTNVKTGYEKALGRAQTMWNNEKTKVEQVLPMLANKWEDREKYISEPFYVQPKLDGVRLLVSKSGCFSRTGKIVKGVEHLAGKLKEGEWLDGECYAPGMTFEDLTSAFKMDPKSLEFHGFDYFDINRPDLPFAERQKILKDKTPVVVDTHLVPKKSQVSKYHQQFVDQGHEGIMIREATSTYEIGKRSNYLLKFKEFQTEEYEIIGAKTGHGRDANAVVWVCKTASGQEFTAKPEGTIKERERYYREREQYMGKQLTVRFQNLTALGVPRFPVGVAIRDYE